MSREIEISYNNVDVNKLHKVFAELNLICKKEKTLMRKMHNIFRIKKIWRNNIYGKTG